MSSLRGRPRSSTVNSIGPVVDDQQVSDLVDKLAQATDAVEPATDVLQALENRSDILQELRSILVEDPRRKDAFRNSNGFQVLLQDLRTVCQYPNPETTVESVAGIFFTYLKGFVDVLAECLYEHSGNQTFFNFRVGGNGWAIIRDCLFQAHILQTLRAPTDDNIRGRARIFGLFLSFALKEEAASSFYTSIATQLQLGSPSSEDQHVSSDKETDRNLVAKSLSSQELLVFPQALGLMFDLWNLWRTDSHSSALTRLQSVVLQSMSTLCSSSEHNSVAIHSTGIFSSILRLVVSTHTEKEEHGDLKVLLLALARQGLSNQSDALLLFQEAKSTDAACTLLLEVLEAAREPARFHFDLSICGYAAVEFHHMMTNFPPFRPQTGYSLGAFLRIERFDKQCHVTIFGAFDKDQSCFVLLYVERESRQLVLQTSVSSSRPSIRFKSKIFAEKIWYHVFVTHEAPQPDGSSFATLFLDGRFCERLQCTYPSRPTSSLISKQGSRVANVQCFWGTPRDLSPKLGHAMLKNRWSISNAHLFASVIPEDLIFVYKTLGPFYSGNYQDCLGSFQTYQASALLNMRNEALHGEKQDNSIISNAIRHKAGKINVETNLLVGISTAVVFRGRNGREARANGMESKLDYRARRLVRQHMSAGVNAITVNSATPDVISALSRPSGVGIIVGGVTICSSQQVETALWSASGTVGPVLDLVHAANTSKHCQLATKIFFETFRNDWRNSEVMEREHGFAMFSWLLKEKLLLLERNLRTASPIVEKEDKEEEGSALSYELLQVILEALGYNSKNPERSLIINPLGYRALVVDCDLWRVSDIKTQKLYYSQFVTFLRLSRYAEFNSKRLIRMRVSKRILDICRSTRIPIEVRGPFLDAFKEVLGRTSTPETHRALALTITYHLAPKRQSNSVKSSPIAPQKRAGVLDTLPRAGSSLRRIDSLVVPSIDQKSVVDPSFGLDLLQLYTDFLCDETGDNIQIKKFARTVTNKWLLYLLCVNSSSVLLCSLRILSKLMVVHGTPYISKFETKTNGFVIMRKYINQWWHLPQVWNLAFLTFFGVDEPWTGQLNEFLPEKLFKHIQQTTNGTIACEEIMVVTIGLLEDSIRFFAQKSTGGKAADDTVSHDVQTDSLVQRKKLLKSVMRFFTMISSFDHVRNYMLTSNFCRDILRTCFAPCSEMWAEEANEDLHQLERVQDSSFEQPISNLSFTSQRENDHPNSAVVEAALPEGNRSYSFILVNGSLGFDGWRMQTLRLPLAPDPSKNDDGLLQDGISAEVLGTMVSLFTNHLLSTSDFTGLGLYLKVPPCAASARAKVTSSLMSRTFSSLESRIGSPSMCDPKILINISRFVAQAYEAITEGWFTTGVDSVVSFVGNLAHYFDRDDVKDEKIAKLCRPTVGAMRITACRCLLLALVSDGSRGVSMLDTTNLQLISIWKSRLLGPFDIDVEVVASLCILVFRILCDGEENPTKMAITILQYLDEQHADTTWESLIDSAAEDHRQINLDLLVQIRSENQKALSWVMANRDQLQQSFRALPKEVLEDQIAAINSASIKSAKTRVARRKERIEQWHLNELEKFHAMTEHDTSSRHWFENISSAEQFKNQRWRQDQTETNRYHRALFQKTMYRSKHLMSRGVGGSQEKWQLNDCEGPSRIRLRLMPLPPNEDITYRSKRNQGLAAKPSRPQMRLQVPGSDSVLEDMRSTDTPLTESPAPGTPQHGPQTVVDDFEVVAALEAKAEDEVEDKNRKVMRSLERGEEVQNVQNASRIVGLEARATLLITGNKALYLLEGLFQRSDGEIVDTDAAPKDERDPYTWMISGSKFEHSANSTSNSMNTRVNTFVWTDIVSLSKRTFLLRDVALEAFFRDGRSFLLTCRSRQQRDTLFVELTTRSQVTKPNSTNTAEGSWRAEMLPTYEETSKTLGSRITNVLVPLVANKTTKQWIRGEMSNFHYLMLINTMAGRSFNDLTQYPVFPWVIADYTSEELDLTNPNSFRDLSKPMGCQTPEREAAFRERYATFADMDDQTPPFHYGTHYSSAMIVASYLIRLPPFVQSYLLMQGGAFDHAERLFYSMEKAWRSASIDAFSDVRELIPEFFYLPDFLTNINGYDFGAKQGQTESISDVILPPWAKGDPTIFIAKNREALESQYVSQNLHHWIDLVFGFKQRGEAALEATNVFHHLSYQGAKDLDSIEDDHERAATIGIIHNFGQTPRQIFHRAHERRAMDASAGQKLAEHVKSLTKSPSPIQEIYQRVATLRYNANKQMIHAAGPFADFLLTQYNIVVEWGFADCSVRFRSLDKRKNYGLFEQLHTRRLATLAFLDTHTLVTASEDSSISVWSLTVESDVVDLEPKRSLFGHSASISGLCVSHVFGTLVSTAGKEVIFWDSSRLELVREFESPYIIQDLAISNVTGHLLLCGGQHVLLYTLNGTLLIDQNMCELKDDAVTSVAFYETESKAWSATEIVMTGHAKGAVKIWKLAVSSDGRWQLEYIRGLSHIDGGRRDGRTVQPPVTCILACEQKIFTGDEEGRVFQWNFGK